MSLTSSPDSSTKALQIRKFASIMFVYFFSLLCTWIWKFSLLTGIWRCDSFIYLRLQKHHLRRSCCELHFVYHWIPRPTTPMQHLLCCTCLSIVHVWNTQRQWFGVHGYCTRSNPRTRFGLANHVRWCSTRNDLFGPEQYFRSVSMLILEFLSILNSSLIFSYDFAAPGDLRTFATTRFFNIHFTNISADTFDSTCH